MVQPLRLRLLRLVGVLGIIVACYALYVEYRVMQSHQVGMARDDVIRK
jgi:succinate-acetate transporter protein